MQFSIGGVPLKCTKDMFSWSKLKWSLCVYWAQFWRGMILFLVCTVIGGVLFAHSDLFQVMSSVSGRERILVLASWFSSVESASWVLGLATIVGLLIAVFYISYYTLVKKHYRSFDRLPVSNSFPYAFWSGSHWGRFLLSFLYSLIIASLLSVVTMLVFFAGLLVFMLIGLIPGASLAAATIGGVLSVAWYVLGYIAMLLLPMHIMLHGGTWGFVPVAKQGQMDTLR